MGPTERVARSARIVGIGIGTSRILGYLRDMLIASRFGAGPIADAFFVAFMIPNLFRDLLAEGALSSAFIPVFTEYLISKGRNEAWLLASRIIGLVLLSTITISLIGIFLTPFIFSLIPDGLIKGGDPKLTLLLLRIMFPFIIFISLAALTMAILNSLGRFGLPAFSSAMLNTILIATVLLFWSRDRKEAIIGQAVAVLVGGAFQFLIQIPGLFKEEMSYSFSFDFMDKGVRRTVSLMIPRAMGTAAYQLNALICRTFAWAIRPGWVSCLYLADRLIQLPVSLFGISLSTALFPTLARYAVIKDLNGLKDSLSSSLRFLLSLAIPSSIGLIVLGKPIIKTLFQHNAFTAEATSFTYMALFFYSIGIFGYGGTKLVSSCFYALNDTKTPVIISILSMGVNLTLALLLMQGLEGGGLALATSISSLLNLALLLEILRRRIGVSEGWKVFVNLKDILLASILMGWASYGVVSSIPGAIGVLLAILIGVMVFVIAAKILKIEEADLLMKLVRKG